MQTFFLRNTQSDKHSYMLMKNILTTLLAMMMPILTFGQTSHISYGDTLATSIYTGQTKIISVLGDSYVRNHKRPYEETWHYKVATINGLDYRNHGRNGGCVAFDRSKEGFGPSLLVRYQEMEPNSDIVVIIAGHNDAVKIGDDKDKLSQFKDSALLLIDKIRAHCPNARIGWVSPWWVDHAGFGSVCKVIKAVCKKKKVAFLNNYSKKSIIKVRDADFRKEYFQSPTDNAHLNAKGHDLFLEVGNKFVRRLMK